MRVPGESSISRLPPYPYPTCSPRRYLPNFSLHLQTSLAQAAQAGSRSSRSHLVLSSVSSGGRGSAHILSGLLGLGACCISHVRCLFIEGDSPYCVKMCPLPFLQRSEQRHQAVSHVRASDAASCTLLRRSVWQNAVQLQCRRDVPSGPARCSPR